MAANVSETCRVLVQAIHDFEGAFKETVERIELVQMMAELDWQAKLSHLSKERARLEQERRGLGQRLATAAVAEASFGGPISQAGVGSLEASPCGRGMMRAEQKDEKEGPPPCDAKVGPTAARAPSLIDPERKEEPPSCGPKLGPMWAREPAFIEPAFIKPVGLELSPPSPGVPRNADAPNGHSKVPVDVSQTPAAPPSGPVPKCPVTVHELHELHARLRAGVRTPPTPSTAPQTPDTAPQTPEAPAPRDTRHHCRHAHAPFPARVCHRPTKGRAGGGFRKPCEHSRYDQGGSGAKTTAPNAHGTDRACTRALANAVVAL